MNVIRLSDRKKTKYFPLSYGFQAKVMNEHSSLKCFYFFARKQ